jgi:hypothetical protein
MLRTWPNARPEPRERQRASAPFASDPVAHTRWPDLGNPVAEQERSLTERIDTPQS